MDAVHLHLILNHLPVIGTPFTLALLLVALLRNSGELKRVNLGFVVLITLLTIPVYLSGERAEEPVMDLPEVETAFIDHHEDAASWAFGGQIALGLAALGGLVLTRKGAVLPKWCVGAVLVLNLAVCGMMIRTAYLGGQIRHSEIRPTTQPPPASSSARDVP